MYVPLPLLLTLVLHFLTPQNSPSLLDDVFPVEVSSSTRSTAPVGFAELHNTFGIDSIYAKLFPTMTTEAYQKMTEPVPTMVVDTEMPEDDKGDPRHARLGL